jgi:predicted Zn-dependent protease
VADAAALARAFGVARKAGCECAGALKTVRRTLAVATSGGLRRWGMDGSRDLQIIAADGDASGFAGENVRLGGAIDFDAVAQRAAEAAARSRGAERAEPRPTDVVLGPTAVAELVEWMSMASFGAASVLDGQSLLAGRRGERAFDPRVSIEDRSGPGEIDFDAEGTARAPVAFAEAGVLGQPVTDRLTALRLRDPRGSTGHAAPVTDGGAPRTVHLRVAPGDTAEADLIAAVDDGLYVTRLHYVNGLLDPRRAMTTGLTRDGTFRIRGGRLAGGVRNLRFTDALVDCLGDRLGALGRELRDVPTWWSPGGVITCPAALVRGFRFTGQSR